MNQIFVFLTTSVLLVSCNQNNTSTEKELTQEHGLMVQQHDSIENELNVTEVNYLQLKTAYNSLKLLKSPRIDSLIQIEDSLIKIHHSKIFEHTALLQKHSELEEMYKTKKLKKEQLTKDKARIKKEHEQVLKEHNAIKNTEKDIYELLRKDLEVIRKSSL